MAYRKEDSTYWFCCIFRDLVFVKDGQPMDSIEHISVFLLLRLFYSDAKSGLIISLQMEDPDHRSLPIVYQITMLLGVLAFWNMAIRFDDKSRLYNFICSLASFSFFIFAFHEPTLTIMKKLIFRLYPPQNSLHGLIYYFSIPTLTIAIAVLIALLLQRYTQGFYRLITGGRGNYRNFRKELP